MLWDRIGRKRPPGARQEHLLWALLFLRTYGTEHVNSMICIPEMELDICNPPFRIAYCTFSYSIVVHNFSLSRKKIKWHKRLGGRSFDGCRISVDGTDERICEPTPFGPKWYSHKFHGPGLRYEIGIGIETGYIVWAHMGLFRPLNIQMPEYLSLSSRRDYCRTRMLLQTEATRMRGVGRLGVPQS